LDEVDRLLGIGRYELALVLCRSFSDRTIAELRDAFQYRLGLCLEGLGHWDEALTAYRKLASHTAAAHLAAVALLGQARVWLRIRRPAESKALLCDLLRRSAQPELRAQPFLVDARYLLALAASLELLPHEPPGPFNDHPVCPLTSDWSLDRALDWCKTTGRRPSADAGPAPVEEIVEAQQGEVVSVRIFAHQMSLTSLLDHLAEQARLRLDWSARARQQVEGRNVVAALERTSLPDALRVLTEPLGLVWSIQGDKLSFSSDEEMPAEQLQALRWDNARRTLREAVRAHPRHPLTPAAFLELGDLEATAGNLEEALKWYTRLIREWPRSPLGIEGQYNLGLLRCRQGERSSARQAFYHVIDRAPAHELAPLAYWRIGRIYLDEGDAEQALSPLQRALRSGPGTTAQAAAVLTLAAAHLLTDNPRAANAILLEHRELINQERFRAATVFLDTLARFRAATDRRQRQREAGDLLTALLMAHGDPVLGPSSLVLMGQAYQEMGMHEEMVRVYEKALPSLHGPLASELALALADAYSTLDRRDAAVKMYRRVIEGGVSRGARRARLRLAEIALSEKKPQECLKSCRELLQEQAGVDVPVVLRLMAGAYEQLGERDKAIRCLRGELPTN
jgi:tetratricopeptide (TPR) repeat protein